MKIEVIKNVPDNDTLQKGTRTKVNASYGRALIKAGYAKEIDAQTYKHDNRVVETIVPQKPTVKRAEKQKSKPSDSTDINNK
jgi:hypothetical protein